MYYHQRTECACQSTYQILPSSFILSRSQGKPSCVSLLPHFYLYGSCWVNVHALLLPHQLHRRRWNSPWPPTASWLFSWRWYSNGSPSVLLLVCGKQHNTSSVTRLLLPLLLVIHTTLVQTVVVLKIWVFTKQLDHDLVASISKNCFFFPPESCCSENTTESGHKVKKKFGRPGGGREATARIS